MKNRPLFIPKAILVILQLFAFFALIIGALFKLMHWSGAKMLSDIGLVLHVVSLLPILYDIFINNIRDKASWMFTTFFFPGVAPLIYLFKRDKLIAEANEMQNNIDEIGK